MLNEFRDMKQIGNKKEKRKKSFTKGNSENKRRKCKRVRKEEQIQEWENDS